MLESQQTTSHQPQPQSEQRNSQSNAVEPILPPTQVDLATVAITNQQCSDPVESSNQSTEQLTLENVIDKGRSTFSELIFTKKVCDSGVVLEVTQQKVHYVPDSGYISLARILFVPGDVEPTVINYTFQVLFSTLQDGNVSTLSQFISVCSFLSNNSQYKFCPGLDEKTYFDTYFSTIRYHIKSVRIWEKPFTRIDSKNCSLWHQLSKNSKKEEKKSFEVMCASCKRLHTDLDHQKHRSEVSPARKIARQKPSSHFKLQYLSPTSAAVRKKATQMERSVDKARLARHEDMELLLDDEQSEELCGVMKKIEETCSDKLQEIFQEGDSHAVGKLVRESWELDKLNAKENFF